MTRLESADRSSASNEHLRARSSRRTGSAHAGLPCKLRQNARTARPRQLGRSPGQRHARRLLSPLRPMGLGRAGPDDRAAGARAALSHELTSGRARRAAAPRRAVRLRHRPRNERTGRCPLRAAAAPRRWRGGEETMRLRVLGKGGRIRWVAGATLLLSGGGHGVGASVRRKKSAIRELSAGTSRLRSNPCGSLKRRCAKPPASKGGIGESIAP